MLNTTGRLGMVVALAGLLSLPAFAGTKDWKVESGHSYGEIATEARANQSHETVVLGATKVSGTLRLDSENIANSSFQFDVDPEGNPQDANSYTVLRFRSRTAELAGNGKLRVTGPLTVTRVELEAESVASEGYSGPQFTGRVVKESTREQSFLLDLPGDDPVNAQGQATSDVTAQARINAEDFPELVTAVESTNWPALASGQNCAVSGSGEGYSGYTCTGSAVGQRSITRTASSFGEDYPGDASSVAQAGDTVTIALHLRLVQQGAAVSLSNGQ